MTGYITPVGEAEYYARRDAMVGDPRDSETEDCGWCGLIFELADGHLCAESIPSALPRHTRRPR